MGVISGNIKGKDGANGIDGKDGANGIDGKDGINGVNGTNGIDGKDGANGKDGVSWLYGNGLPPDSLGENGNVYLDFDTVTFYKKENGTWF